MFEPGDTGLLQVIQSRLSPASRNFNDKLYVHGVVNTIKPDSSGETLNVDLVGRGNDNPFELRIVQPEGVAGLSSWAHEVMRQDFLMTKDPVSGQMGVIGHAIIHSKIIIIDPFTNPVIITGSHNFSISASAKNDENMLIIKGNKELAERYCVHIMSAYHIIGGALI
jgi:phosphatidylserine/phosphatidylglycerophosphate/cardiolipin synthase-like enzyme